MFKITIDGKIYTAEKGTLLSSLLMSDVGRVDHPCGGKGICRKCTVLVNGKADGVFAPDDKITRAEFCTMYNRIIGRENALLVDKNGYDITAETYGFTDLDSDEWYYEAMLRATSAYSDDGYVDVEKRGIRNNLDDYGN